MLEGSILQQLAQAHRTPESSKQPLNFGVYYKNTLVALCHALEDCILATHDQPLVITAFQQGKWYLQEADRYGEIAQHAQQIVIMAATGAGFHEHPTSQRENVALVDLESSDPVAQEWHLIILSPEYAAMVLCQELPPEEYGPEGPPEADQARKFYGFWTFESNLVQEATELAIAHIGEYDPDLQQRLSALVADITPALAQAPVKDASVLNLNSVVARVVNYLQTSRDDLGKTTILSRHSHALDYNLVSNELQAFLRMAQLVDLSDSINPGAAAEVTALAEMMGQLIDLPAWQLQRLRLAGLLHRIAPLQDADALLEPEWPSCSLNQGAQVLRTMPRMRAIAQIITHQTEWWDGSGQPAGLAGDEIPLESRILGLLAHFQQQVIELQQQNGPDSASTGLAQALADCQTQQGHRWDPKLIDLLGLLVKGMQQGLTLPNIPPKVTAGVGLLDPDTDDQIYTVRPNG